MLRRGGIEVEAEPSRTPARVAAAALLLGASVLASRGLGYVREAVLAHQVGAGAAMDAYRAAFQLPDLLNYLLAGSAFSIAFIPVYERARRERGELGAERLFSTVLGTTAAGALALTAVMWCLAGPLTALLFPEFAPDKQALTAHLTRIVLPAQAFFVTGGVLKAVLMAHGRFGAQALAPVVYNLGIISGGLALGGALGIEGFAWGALFGAALGSFAIPLADALRRLRVRVRIAPADPDFLRYVAAAAPLVLGLSLLTVDEWYERIFGGRLADGTVARLGYARQLMLVPVAVVGQAVATAAMPVFARLHSEGRRDELARLVLRALQTSAGLGVLCASGVFVLARPLVELLYRRGAFTFEDADAVARLLQILCLAVPAWVTQQIAARSFYARNDMWRPTGLSISLALGAIPLYLELGGRFGANGIAAAGVLAISANALATVLLGRRLHGAPALRPLGASFARAAAIGLGAGAAAHLALRGQAGLLGAILDLALGGAAFGVVALTGVALAGDEALRAALRRLAAPALALLRRLRR
jgi:putative peptidoglycan lipid II flippase